MLEWFKWWVLHLAMIIATIGILSAFKPVSVWWDRQVMVESHQYKEARATEVAILRVQLIGIDRLLATETDAIVKSDLIKQKRMLQQQIDISYIRSTQ